MKRQLGYFLFMIVFAAVSVNLDLGLVADPPVAALPPLPGAGGWKSMPMGPPLPAIEPVAFWCDWEFYAKAVVGTLIGGGVRRVVEIVWEKVR